MGLDISIYDKLQYATEEENRHEYDSFNITHNLCGMAEAAGFYNELSFQ